MKKSGDHVEKLYTLHLSGMVVTEVINKFAVLCGSAFVYLMVET
jgi:hypothetical protein